MILELVDIRIQPGKQAAFQAALQRGLDQVITQAKGFQGYRLNHGIESPERYVLMFYWATLENPQSIFASPPPLRNGAASSAHFLRTRQLSNTST